MAMKHQNKSIFRIFIFSMAVLDGAHSYLKCDMVMGLDTKLPPFCYFINSGIGWGQSWLFGKPAVSGFSNKKTAVSGFPAGFFGNHLMLRIALITDT